MFRRDEQARMMILLAIPVFMKFPWVMVSPRHLESGHLPSIRSSGNEWTGAHRSELIEQ